MTGILSFFFFHIYLNIFAGHLDLISDLSDREALKIDFPNAIQGACMRTDTGGTEGNT